MDDYVYRFGLGFVCACIGVAPAYPVDDMADQVVGVVSLAGTSGSIWPGDLNCDGSVDCFDIAPFNLALLDPGGYAAQYPECNLMNADIDGDGEVDIADNALFQDLLRSEVCVAPPDCADCGSNGVIDVCDIALGTSADCNANGTPDECELDDPPDINVVQDPSFETGTPNPFWNEESTNFLTPLCDPNLCNTAVGSGARTGNWWVWFGGIAAFEAGAVDQNVSLPPSATSLEFFLEIPTPSGNGTDYVQVAVDGNILLTIYENAPGYAMYAPVQVDISAYADGGTHNIRFESEISGVPALSNFFVDDVSIIRPGGPPPNDCNTNGILDECELEGNDCNANLIPDDCDIAAGTSRDCQPNGVPDECDLGGVGGGQIVTRTTHAVAYDGLDYLMSDSDLISFEIPMYLPGDNGWHPSNVDPATQLSAFTDGLGELGSGLTGLLNDFPITTWPTKLVEYDFAEPRDIGRIHIFTGNVDIDGRIFSHLGIWYSTDHGSSFQELGCFHSDPWGTINQVGNPANLPGGPFGATLLEIYNDSGAVLITGVTNIEFDFYPVDNTLGENRDRYDGVDPSTGQDDGLTSAFVSPKVFEIDVIAHSGPPPNDCNTNSIPDDCDIAAGTSMDLNANSIPDECEEIGACCDTNGACEVLPEAECAGVWMEGIGCDPNPCPGACCLLPNGACVDVTEDLCVNGYFGTFHGGSTCATQYCPAVGACCMPDGVCRELAELGGGDCVSSNGVYLGDDTSCYPTNPCPQPGACCWPDLSCTAATLVGGADCTAAGGVYQGDGTDCSPNPCVGACCYDGECADATRESDCLAIGGTWHSGTGCFSFPCLGACCNTLGCLWDATLPECRLLPAEWYAGESCGDPEFQCPAPVIGACCLGGGACLGDMPKADCLGLWSPDASWHEGESCVNFACPIDVPLGACCDYSLGCVPETTPFECFILLMGNWFEGASCDPVPPECFNAGACCIRSDCQDLPARIECLLAGGLWDGGEWCAEVSCPDLGDCNGDRVVDLADFAELAECLIGPGKGLWHPRCTCFDLNEDGDADLRDFALFQSLFTGPPVCGNGIVEGTEECDDGLLNSDTTPDACRTTCVTATCGDTVVDTGEECDDGPLNSDTAPDACRTMCVAATCGDDVVDTGEACDDGPLNSDTTPDACRTTCVAASCGDGVVDTGEECDDLNTNGGDGCSAECVNEENPLPECVIDFDPSLCPTNFPVCGASFMDVMGGMCVTADALCADTPPYAYVVLPGPLPLFIELDGDLSRLKVAFSGALGSYGEMWFYDEAYLLVDAPLVSEGDCFLAPPPTYDLTFSHPVRYIEVHVADGDAVWIDTFHVNPP